MTLKELGPWDEVEHALDEQAPADRSPAGRHPVPVRVSLGSLIIKAVLGLTDRETVAQIQENPYLQAFLGYASYSSARPFDRSLMVALCKRFDADLIDSINRLVVDQFHDRQQAAGSDHDDGSDVDESGGPGVGDPVSDHAPSEDGSGTSSAPAPDGTLMLDATCAPADHRGIPSAGQPSSASPVKTMPTASPWKASLGGPGDVWVLVHHDHASWNQRGCDWHCVIGIESAAHRAYSLRPYVSIGMAPRAGGLDNGFQTD